MRIFLKHNYNNKIVKEFDNKERLISSIDNISGLRDWEDIYFYAKQDGFSQNINKWTIKEIVKLFYSDYKIVKKEKER